MKKQLKHCLPGTVVRFGPNTVNCIVLDLCVPAARLIKIKIEKTGEGFWKHEDDEVWTDQTLPKR